MDNSGLILIGNFVDWLAAMPSWILWLLLAIVIVMLLFVIFSIPKLRILLPAAPIKVPKEEVEDTGMVRACRRFHANLRTAFPGGKSQYRLPLYLAIGPSAVATRSCIRESGLSMPLGEPLSSGGLTWSAFDRGSVVEISPSVFGQASRWRAFIRLLQRFRPHRPLDGIIVVIPADEFDPETPDFEKSLREAEQIRNALAELGNRIVMAVPIYCVIAQCEKISGFDSLGKIIERNSLLKPLGFTSPYDAGQVYRPEIVQEALTSIADRIQILVMHALTIEAKDLDRDTFFNLPKSFKNLVPKMQDYFDVLMQPGQFSQLSSLRGIYVNGFLSTGKDGAPDLSAFAHGALQDKIFPEYRMATPTINSWSSANRNVRKAQIAVGSLLVLGIVGLVAESNILENRVPGLSATVAGVSRDFLRISIAQTRPGALEELFRRQSGPIIQRLSGIDSAFLETVLVPNSYFGGLAGDIDSLRAAAFVELLVKNIGRSLKNKATKVTRETSGTRFLIDTGATDREYPDYQLLENFVGNLDELIVQMNNYKNIQSGEKDQIALNDLTTYLFDIRLPAGYFPKITLDELTSQNIVLENVNSAKFVNQAQASLLQDADIFYSDLTNRDNLLSNLRSVASNLAVLQVSFDLNLGHAVGHSSQGRVQIIFNNLQFLKLQLADGKYDWLLNDKVIISKEYEDLIFRIRNNSLLGPKVADKLKRRAIRIRGNMREAVLNVRVPKLGTLVQAVDGRLSLSPGAREITKELEASGKALRLGIKKPEFIVAKRAEYNQNPLPKPLSRDSFIKWDISELRHGSQKLAQLLKSKSTSAATPGLLAAFKRIEASERINLILQTLNRAFVQKYFNSPVVAGSSNTSLDEWSANFRDSSEMLESFILALKEPGTSQIRSDLINLIASEGVKIISYAKEEFHSKGFYLIDKTALDRWDGTTGLANRLFGGLNSVALVATLDQQRFQIKSIASSQVESPLGFLLKYSEVLNSDVIEDIVFWRLILEDLVAYKNQIPNNNILRLEQFLVTNLRSMSVGDCKIGSNSGRPGGASYFSQKLQKISIATVGGCKRIKNSVVQIAYNKFASRFNNKFVGKVPFFIAPNSHTESPDIDPRSLINLFGEFDNSMNRGMGDPSFWPPGEKTKNIIGFLNQFDDAVSTLRPGIVGDQNNAKMVYEITPTFRVLRDQETGGDQIIDWSMTVGDKSVRFTDQKRLLVWETGKLIKFKFRWAKNSEAIPVGDDKNNDQFSSGNDLTLVFNGSWALFSLVGKYGKLNTAASAYNLQFDIPIARKSKDDETSPAPYGKAKIFVELKLTINGQNINLPRFPKHAPAASF